MAEDADKPQNAEIPGGWETAPVIHFDNASSFGVSNHGGRITLETTVLLPVSAGTTLTPRRVVAFLAGSGPAFASLAGALAEMEKMATGPGPGEKPN